VRSSRGGKSSGSYVGRLAKMTRTGIHQMTTIRQLTYLYPTIPLVNCPWSIVVVEVVMVRGRRLDQPESGRKLAVFCEMNTT